VFVTRARRLTFFPYGHAVRVRRRSGHVTSPETVRAAAHGIRRALLTRRATSCVMRARIADVRRRMPLIDRTEPILSFELSLDSRACRSLWVPSARFRAPARRSATSELFEGKATRHEKTTRFFVVDKTTKPLCPTLTTIQFIMYHMYKSDIEFMKYFHTEISKLFDTCVFAVNRCRCNPPSLFV